MFLTLLNRYADGANVLNESVYLPKKRLKGYQRVVDVLVRVNNDLILKHYYDELRN